MSSGILCNFCRLSPNATYVGRFGGLACCARCYLSMSNLLGGSSSTGLVHWRSVGRRP